MYTQDQGNNETISRGVFSQNNNGTRWCAMTFSESKHFATKAGAVRWLARRGYDENGKRLDWQPLTAQEACHAHQREASGFVQP